jgi:hypothetical protein
VNSAEVYRNAWRVRWRRAASGGIIAAKASLVPTPTPETAWAYYTLAGLLSLVAVLLAVLLLKNRRFREGHVFVASRWTRGNRIFPTQVAITPASVVQYKAQWLGRQEQSIHTSHVASVTIDTGLMFSDVTIETSGGSEPIVCHGHRKGDALRMKELIEGNQTAQARGVAAAAPPAQEGPTRVCPFCAETIKAAARVCRYCGRELKKA